MKRSLLDMVQSILTSIDGDAVNSISDTVESIQVAQQIRNCYFELIDEMQLPANHEMCTLDALSDVSQPHVMRLPDKVSRILFFTYDKRTSTSDPLEYEEVAYKAPKDFIQFCNNNDSSDTVNYFVWTPSGQLGLKLTIGKKEAPTYWTTFDDEHIVFNSYDSVVESSMQQSKTQAYCEIRPTFTVADNFVPDLPENLFTRLLSMSENRCFLTAKQQVNPLTNQAEGRLRVRTQRNKFRQERDQNKFDGFPDYGRRR
jgi:hypothetical protein